jgi:hypothetical protein
MMTDGSQVQHRARQHNIYAWGCCTLIKLP